MKADQTYELAFVALAVAMFVTAVAVMLAGVAMIFNGVDLRPECECRPPAVELFRPGR